MKVLLVDSKLTGHHLSYLEVLSESEIITPIIVLPEKVDSIVQKQIITKNKPDTFLTYVKWIKEIKQIAQKNKVDVIHFLYGDDLYKGGGLYLRKLKKYRPIVTMHQIRRSFLRDLSRRLILNKVNCGVVHTNKLNKEFEEMSIYNVHHIEYPKFSKLSDVEQTYSKKYFSIPANITTFLALGGTRKDKGLDILLSALDGISQPFHLLIAGKEEFFSEEFIKDKISKFNNKVTIVLRYLTEEEMNMAISAADVIVLPYRKSFNGASGPLTDGVWHRKLILGSNHGSLGDIINTNSIGITFESENINSLRIQILQLLDNGVLWSEDAESYRKKLDTGYFLKEYEELYIN